MAELKAGWKTSEFWALLLTNGALIAISIGLLTTQQATELSDAATKIVSGIFGVVSAVNAIVYSKDRTALKKTNGTDIT